MEKVRDVIIVGVGGQGIILASQILAQAAVLSGFDVKVAETHGMAQRGGSVITHVRLGQQVFSPTVQEGSCQCLLGFEMLETARSLSLLAPDGIIITSTQKLHPLSVASGQATYPDNLEEVLGKRNALLIPALDSCKELGNPRVVNLVMLGALSVFMEIEPEAWQKCICNCVPERFLEVNQKAFTIGQRYALERRS
ncbi:MAG: indolepyruvate oxidoreductase subunit beta [Limnochordia bacterium]|nr:indolepyruvate oxidoreductase subunit beta [Limnochordia bacterium]